jgi:hypothetical protein
MASLCQRIHFPHSVAAMEAYAARSAIQLTSDLGLKEVDIEGDSQTIVNALLYSNPCCTLYRHLVNDTKLIAQSGLSVKFLHVKCDGKYKTQMPLSHVEIPSLQATAFSSTPPPPPHDDAALSTLPPPPPLLPPTSLSFKPQLKPQLPLPKL